MNQMDDARLRKDQLLELIIRMGIANDQAVKVVDRITPDVEQKPPK